MFSFKDSKMKKGGLFKNFSKRGKKSSNKKSIGDMKSSSISPSVEEFDDMMSKASGKSKKKSMFKKK
jgi:hypothetical protein